ncbi:hypothetical protein SEA_GREENHEARTS_56 [Arthrobacter phage GreenHearts]|uniref:Uncharacterized protein n=1 Tax=Arthrobacter phage GreenHearts TaxID=2499003 RepID=A0A3S9UCL4_9CAUD|nr:hypothetical protein KDI97_gp56 [Arthrobacter phage GreenHearts]AZS08035.1 hypothetical protein SEA_GREENHEARTS_56 [Arthrobacter phage GreenHearts]
MTETQNTTAKAVTTRHCTCGCGEATSSAKTMYKPGHDARHAGNVARAIAEAVLNGTEAEVSLTDLPTANLVHKADAMSKRLVEKARAKADRTAARKPSDKPAKPAAKISEVVAAEEAAHAEEEAAKVPEPMFDEVDKHIYTYGTVKIGRWEYPTRTSRQGFIGVKGVQTVTERNEKRDGSGKWIQIEA